MSDLFVPFNNAPVVTKGLTSGYTVPAGKYAKVVVSMDVSADGFFESTIPNDLDAFNNGNVTSSSQARTVDIWLAAGDQITYSSSTASSSDSRTAGGSSEPFTLHTRDNSTATLRVVPSGGASVIISNLSVYAQASISAQVVTGETLSAKVQGSSNISGLVMEYNQQT